MYPHISHGNDVKLVYQSRRDGCGAAAARQPNVGGVFCSAYTNCWIHDAMLIDQRDVPSAELLNENENILILLFSLKTADVLKNTVKHVEYTVNHVKLLSKYRYLLTIVVIA